MACIHLRNTQGVMMNFYARFTYVRAIHLRRRHAAILATQFAVLLNKSSALCFRKAGSTLAL